MNCNSCHKEVYYFKTIAYDRTDDKLIEHKCDGGNGHTDGNENKKTLTMEDMHIRKIESEAKLIESNHAIANAIQALAAAILMSKDVK